MKRNPYLLLNWAFLGSLFILILNDHCWKWAYANALTGKLSDFAGLLLLPLLLSYCQPKMRRWATIISGLFFVFWKSPYSEGFLEAYNTLAFIPLTRVVDYSDLLALLMLPLADYWIRQPERLPRLVPIRHWLVAPLLASFTLFCFSATSPSPRYYFTYNHGQGDIKFHNTSYDLKMSKRAVLEKISTLGFDVDVDTALIKTFVELWPYQPDTLEYGEAAYYRIKQMIVKEDTLRNIQFGLQDFPSQEKTTFYLNAVRTSAPLDSTEIDRKLRRVYKRFIKKEVIRALGGDA